MSLAHTLALGVPHAPVSNCPFSVEDSDSVWLVQSGRLDIFLVQTKNGEPAGARHYILSVNKGEAIFGTGPHLPNVALVASAIPETELFVFSQVRLREGSGARSSDEDVIVPLLENWIERFSAALTGDVVHRSFVALEAGETITLPDTARAIVPKQSMVWVWHDQGESQFLANVHLHPISGKNLFPVSKHGWLQAAPNSVLHGADSRTFLRLDAQWMGLRDFHALAMAYLVSKHEKLERRDQARFRARAESDSTLLQTALRRLLAPVAKRDELGERRDACNDPVFLAMETIGNRLGLTAKPHPDMLRNIKVADPVMAISKASGIRVRRVTLRDKWWKLESGPMLVFREQDNAPLALLPRSSRRFDCYDPALRQTLPLTAEIAGSLNPFAYVLYRPFPARKIGVVDLLEFGLHGCRGELSSIAFMGVATGILGLVVPFATGVVFDRMIPGAERSQLAQVSVFLFMTVFAGSMFAFVRGIATVRLQGRVNLSLQAAIWDRLLSLPVSFFREYSAGELAQRSLGIARIQEMLTSSALTAILSSIFSVFSFLLLFYYSIQLALLATGLVTIAFLVTLVCGFYEVRSQRQLVRLQNKLSSTLLQFVEGIAKFRVSGTETRAFAVWARDFSRQKQLAMSARLIANLLAVFDSAFPIICLATIFYYYGSQVANSGTGLVTTGEFLAFLAAFMQFLMGILALSSTLVVVLRTVPMYEETKPILGTLPEVTEAKTNPGELTGTIEINRVNFRYKPDSPLVLNDFSLKIQPGQFIAIVGASGSGKSTLFRLLLGFEAPESGAIYYNGHDLSMLDIQALRRQLGVVLQSSRPISGAILHNIIGSSPLTLDDAWEAARLAGIDEDIRKLPMGMHTHLSDGGGNISGGQRQRLMIARAIVGRPRILLFDEATSALDNQTQAVVSRSLESLQATRVVIAHRLSTIRNADVIYVVDKGVIVQNGSYQELIEKEGLFQELVRRQLT